MMKNITFLLFFFIQTTIYAQINGNGNKVTKSFPIDNLLKLEINLTADITIDAQAQSGLTITTDENVMDYINVKTKNGYLDLTQLDWIEPKGGLQVVIGAPDLESIICDAHSKVEVKNLNGQRFKVRANVGTISLKGKLDYLDLNVNVATVNAETLSLQTADVKIKSWGKVFLGTVDRLRTNIDKSGTLNVLTPPEKLSKETKEALTKTERPIHKEARYIDFKIKNNSWKRNQFYVVGPKQDGSYFSYGFPLNPGREKSERWTTGTKVYKVSKLGIRTLLVTIDAANENEVVKLFDK